MRRSPVPSFKSKDIIMAEPASKDDSKDDKKKDEPSMGKAWGHLKGALPSLTTIAESGESMIKNLQAIDTADSNYGVNNARLIMSDAEFEKMIEPAVKKAGTAAQRYKSKFIEYRGAVNALHARAQRYKSLLAEEARLLAEASAAQGQIRRIRAMVAAQSNPDLSAYKCYLEGRYTDLKAQILDAIHEEHRAVSLETLDNSPFPATSDQSIAQLRETHVKLASQILDSQRSQDLRPQIFKAELEWKATDYPELFAVLRERGRILLVIDPADPKVKEVFLSRKNVCVTRCMVILPGVTSNNGRVQVAITHMGDERFLDNAGNWHNFSHDPIGLEFEQKYDAQGVPGEELGGGQIMVGPFAAASPFTAWQIHLPSEDGLNKGLSLDKVTSLKIKFEYTARTKRYSR